METSGKSPDTGRKRFLPHNLRGSWRLFSFAFLLLLGFGLLATLLMVQATSQPKFCGSCHVMEPYYESWLTSSHREVACVECHIPPGISSEVEKKIEGLSMMVSYVTGTYGTNPWAEVDDAACLECHQRRLLSGKEVFGDILFDHGPHLNELRREKKLRCTSCHSQIVQGSHINVTTSTCVLCHFKGQPLNTDTGQCTLCHAVPEKVIEKGTLSFDHGDVKRFDMQCAWCHRNVVKGDGSAPQQRCYVCHNDPSRLTKYEDHPELHRIHVTDHKVECLHCHTEIQHGNFAEHREIAGTACATCHSDGHSPQRDLYVGIGGKGLQPRPSVMNLAGIHCEGCHFLPREKEVGFVQSASEVSCMACHGPRYSKMLDRWKNLLDERIGQARRELTQVREKLGPAGNRQIADVRANLRLVERGRGVHNVDYALDILEANHAMLNAALQTAGHQPLSAALPSVPYESDCLRCHQGVETQTGTYQGHAFAHRPHVVGQALDCQQCHQPHEERSPDEVVQLPAGGCISCHHAPEQNPEDNCADCHSAITDALVDYQGDEFSHAYHVEDEEMECVDCHTLEGSPGLDLDFCVDCHD